LIAGGPGDVDLAGGSVVRQNAGQERQGIANIARAGIGEIDNLLRGQLLGGGGLGRVNRRRGIVHLDALLIFLLMMKRDVNGFCLPHLHGRIQKGVEAFLFDGERIGAGSKAGEFGAAGEIGGRLERGFRTGRGERQEGARNHDAGFVLNRDCQLIAFGTLARKLNGGGQSRGVRRRHRGPDER